MTVCSLFLLYCRSQKVGWNIVILIPLRPSIGDPIIILNPYSNFLRFTIMRAKFRNRDCIVDAGAIGASIAKHSKFWCP